MTFSSVAKSLNEVAEALSNGTEINLGEKEVLMAACDRMKASLEAPIDNIFRINLGVHVFVATRLGVEMGIFNAMAEKSEVDIKQLASETGADPDLVARVMRMLAGAHVVNDLGEGKYSATPTARALVSSSPLSDSIIHYGLVGEILVKLPYFLAETGYQNPGDAYNGPFQYAFNTKIHFFDYMKSQPKQQASFNSLMQIHRMSRGQDWFEFYPVESKLKNGNEVLLVDIGGGVGHDLRAFKAKYPQLPGRLIVQDLPVAIEDIKEIPEGLEVMKYDFFKPQPIKGARGYYMRTVLHDWPDKQARQILDNVHEAMDENSILLINENCLPDSGVGLYHAAIDLTMMANFASLDRTEQQMRDLLESAGFKVVKIWKPDVAVEGSATLFEAMNK